MNIIEAIQAAENGAIITNNFLKMSSCFLKYSAGKNGVFVKYQSFDNKQANFIGEVKSFSTAHILSNAWEVVTDIWFNV